MITIYISTLASNVLIKKQQQSIRNLLDANKVDYAMVDVASSVEDKEKMRELAGDSTSLPPQIANGEKYCGNYDLFMDAIENNRLGQFLQISGEN